MQITFDPTSIDSFAAAWVTAKSRPGAAIVAAPGLTTGPDDVDCTKDTGLAAWKRLYPDEAPPWLLGYVADRAARALPHSDEVNAALDSYPRSAAAWDELAGRDPTANVYGNFQPLVSEGRTVLRYRAVSK